MARALGRPGGKARSDKAAPVSRANCRLRVAAEVCALATFLGASCAAAQTGWEAPYVENLLDFQRNGNGSGQWKDTPKLYLPYRFDSGWTFTQKIAVPLVDTNAAGAGNAGGGYSGGIGDAYVEEIFVSPGIANNLSLKGSLRLVFPTGGQSPFGSGQYQLAPSAGVIYRMPELLAGVTLAPFARYFWGFDPRYDNVKTARNLDLFPEMSFGLAERWSLSLYPENAITWNTRKNTWFVPLDLMLVHRVDRTLEYGLGGAVKLGNPSDPAYRYIIDLRLTCRF